MYKKCVYYNYIPYSRKSNTRYYEWEIAYNKELMKMYDILADTIDEYYPNNNIKWENNEYIANTFFNILFNCSSKYISPYI